MSSRRDVKCWVLPCPVRVPAEPFVEISVLRLEEMFATEVTRWRVRNTRFPFGSLREFALGTVARTSGFMSNLCSL